MALSLSSQWLIAPDEKLPGELHAAVEAMIQQGKVTPGEIDYIERYRLGLLEKTVRLSDKRLERVRALCSLWEIKLKTTNITSHRKFIGPFIVAAKRFIMPFLKVALADLTRQQTAFNAEAVALLAELASDDPKEYLEKKET